MRFPSLRPALVLAALLVLGATRSVQADLQVRMAPTSQGWEGIVSPFGFGTSDSSGNSASSVTTSNGFASLSHNGWNANPRQFTFVAQANSGAAVVATDSSPNASPPSTAVTFQILGTAGETGPVTLDVSNLYTFIASASSTGTASVLLNGNPLLSSSFTSSNTSSDTSSFLFNVGDTFSFFARIETTSSAPSAQGTLITTFTVAPQQAAVPEPGTLSLLLVGALTTGAGFRRRRG